MPQMDAQIAGRVLQPLTSASCDSCGDAGDLPVCFGWEQCSWRGETKAGRGFVQVMSLLSKPLLLYHSRHASAMVLNVTPIIDYKKAAILNSWKKEKSTPVLLE